MYKTIFALPELKHLQITTSATVSAIVKIANDFPDMCVLPLSGKYPDVLVFSKDKSLKWLLCDEAKELKALVPSWQPSGFIPEAGLYFVKASELPLQYVIVKGVSV